MLVTDTDVVTVPLQRLELVVVSELEVTVEFFILEGQNCGPIGIFSPKDDNVESSCYE